jgi:hypothetical protein
MKTATPPNLKQYIGRNVVIDGKTIVIETIVGNVWKPAFYEINSDHLIGMLRFHAQMLNDKSITEQEFKDFEDIDYHIEKINKLEKPKKEYWAGEPNSILDLDKDGSVEV